MPLSSAHLSTKEQSCPSSYAGIIYGEDVTKISPRVLSLALAPHEEGGSYL